MHNGTVTQAERFLPFSAPWFGPEEKKELLEALESDWITTGPRTRRFEQRFATYVGASDAIAVNSCTAALHLALVALNVGRGDAVVTTPFTFAATANVVVHTAAFPAFVDIDPDTYNLDAAKLQLLLEQDCTWDCKERVLRLNRNGCRVRAIIPVHYAGHPCDMDAINALADRFNVAVIEDAAHAAGTKYRGRKAGTLGLAGCFSFYANKNMTTAEGGMLTTNDSQLAERVRVLSLHGISRDAWKRYSSEGTWQYDVLEAGFKYNMTDLAAALGLQQLHKLDNFIARRAELARLYGVALQELNGVKCPTVMPHATSSWHLYAVQVLASSITRNDVITKLLRRNIGCSVHFIPLHLMSLYQRKFGYRRGDFPVAEKTFEHILSLPLFPRMEESDVQRVAEALWAIIAPTRRAMAS